MVFHTASLPEWLMFWAVFLVTILVPLARALYIVIRNQERMTESVLAVKEHLGRQDSHADSLKQQLDTHEKKFSEIDRDLADIKGILATRESYVVRKVDP